MVYALKEQNRIIGQLRREANANFILLDDRSQKTQNLVEKLVDKVKRGQRPWIDRGNISQPRHIDAT